MTSSATQENVTKKAALRTMSEINSSLTARAGPKQAASFWRPAAWPDLLCAYRAKTRKLAVMHVVIAMVLAAICWQPLILHTYIMMAVGVWQGPGFPEFKAIGSLTFLALFSIQLSLPVVYLRVIRYRNLTASRATETSALQANIQNMLQAVSTLKHVSEASTSAPNAGPAADDLTAGQSPNLLRSRQSDVISAPLKACTILQMTAEDASTAFCKTDEGSAAFKAQVAAALEASSQTIANLVARLETMVYHRSGAQIKGHAACTAALEILAGGEKLPATLTEALAAIKIIGSSWPARNPRTPFSQFWRPSAWADYYHAYTPWDRLLLGPCDPLPRHAFIDPFRLCFWGAACMGFAIGQGVSLWLRILGAVGFVTIIGGSARSQSRDALNRNLKVKDRKVSSNMPALFAHLRQLAAAGRMMQDHVPDRCSQPASEPGTASSSLALMHAMKHHAQITEHLMARLQAAYMTCVKTDNQVLLRHLENKNEDEKLDTIENMMELHPYSMYF